MNKCRKCGTEFEGKFCPKCATPIISHPENAAPNDEQFKICPICRQPYKGKFCPRGCGLTNGAIAKKKGLKGWQIALIVIGTVFVVFILFGIIISGTTDEDTLGNVSSNSSEYDTTTPEGKILNAVSNNVAGFQTAGDDYLSVVSNGDNSYTVKVKFQLTNESARCGDDAATLISNVRRNQIEANKLIKKYEFVFLSPSDKNKTIYTAEFNNNVDNEIKFSLTDANGKKLPEKTLKQYSDEYNALKKKQEEERKKQEEEERKKELESYKSITYKELVRNPEKYKGQKIKITVEIQQIMEEGILKSGGYRAYEDYDISEGDTWLQKEWYIDMIPSDGDGRILEDDIVTFYGEYSGLTEVKRALTGAKEQIPTIKVKYSQIHK